MARFYLQYCYEDISQQSKYYKIIDKYLNTNPGTINSRLYQYDGDFSYEFENEIKSYSVHSFSNTIGKNMTLLKTPYGSIIIDCGAKCCSSGQELISKNDLLNFLSAYDVTISDIKAVLISHAHLDHYGSIPTLLDAGISPVKFYADVRTKELILTATGEDLLYYSRPFSSFFWAGNKVQLHAFDNGHILGSQALLIHFDNINVVYTGDFCLHDQKTVNGWDVLKIKEDILAASGINCLISESTYGKAIDEILPYDTAVNAFSHILRKLVENQYKIFLPAFATGRSQELILMLNDKYRVLVDGLAIKMCMTYDRFCMSKIMNGYVRFAVNNDNKNDNFELNDIIIASSGMIAENSTSDLYMKSVYASDAKVAIIRTGYMDSSEESYGYAQIRKWKESGRMILDSPISAHADYRELLRLINELSPENVVSIHGAGIAVRT